MTGSALVDDVRTTAGAIALGNLQAQIDGLSGGATANRLTVRARASLTELVALRGHVLGRIADHEWAEALAERLVQDAPSDGDALLARARRRADFHRFDEALIDLDAAQRVGADQASLDAERAAILGAIGRYDDAQALCLAAVKRRADFHALGALATLHAEHGEIAAAEEAFSESRARYRDVSPIPLAQLDLRRAQMWIAHGDLRRARMWLEDAIRRLPAHVPAAGHLAGVEAALGETDAAIARLLPVTRSSDDPEYPAQLARLLAAAGRLEDAGLWRAQAAARYDELLARHPAAFADHAAEFWLEARADPCRALSLATKNLEVRRTRRAYELVARATRVVDGAAPRAAPSTVRGVA